MWIDLQIPAHLGEKVAADLFSSILEGSEFLAEVQPAMASPSFSSHEFARDLHPSSQPSHAALEFRALHDTMIGQFCPRVKRGRKGAGLGRRLRKFTENSCGS
jgi:hypothetical protein